MTYHDILRFDVSVVYFVAVEIADSQQNLPNDKCSCLLTEPTDSLQLFVQLAICRQLTQQIKILRIFKKTVKGYNVGMLNETANFDLSDQLAH